MSEKLSSGTINLKQINKQTKRYNTHKWKASVTNHEEAMPITLEFDVLIHAVINRI